MKTGIGKLLQIAQGDRSMIGALLLQAAFTGIFVGAIELEANAVFLESFGAAKVPLGLMISGAAGILITSVYSYFSKQLGVRAFGIYNLIAVMAMTAALIFGFLLLEIQQLDYVIFVLAGPLILITLLGFWTTVRGTLSPSRGKQLTGLIDATLIGGMILSFILTPLLVSLDFSLHHILYVGMGSLIMAASAQFYVLNKIGQHHHRNHTRVQSTGPLRLFSHKYTALMAAFAFMGIAVSVLIHYSFLSVTGNRFPGGIDLVTFLGYIFGSMMLLAWLMKRFLFSWVKRKFGIKMTLLLAPVALLLFTILGAIAGESYGFGGQDQLFTYFFLLVVFTKMVGRTLKESMEDTSLNLIYQSLAPNERPNVQSGIEGVVSQIAVFTSALLLAALVEISRVDVIHVLYLLFVFLLIWFFVGRALYQNYHRMLKVTLESDKTREVVDLTLDEMVDMDLQKTAFPLELMEFNPYFFHYTSRERKISLLSHPNSKVRIRIWDHLLSTSPGLPDLTISQLLVNEKDPEVKDRIRKLGKRKLRTRLGLQEAFIRERLDKFSPGKSKPDNAIGEAFHSGVGNEIYAAMYHVAEEHDKRYLHEVISLFRDKDPNIQAVALSTAGLIDTCGNGVKIIDFLDHPDLYSAAWSSLVRQGEAVLDELETAFCKPDTHVKLQKRIVSVISAIGGGKANQSLLDKLDYHHREVFQSVVQGLYENRFKASEIQVALIQNAILKLVQTGTWNMAAKISVRTDNPGGSLAKAIEHEIWDVNEKILMLMSMIYDRRSVHRIRLSLLDRESADRGMAIELLGLLLGEPLKSVLLSYFHDITVREKIDKLREIYPIDILPIDLLLKRILNRDGSQMGDFIRICVLERMGNVQRFFDEQQIIAQGFHPNPKIRETAAQLLRKNDPERFHMITERLDYPDNSFPDHEDAAKWYMDTTMKLTDWKLFLNVGINALFKLVSEIEPFSEELLSGGDFVVLARSASAENFTPLSLGIAIIAEHQPEILEQIRYLATIEACEVYLIERRKFVELLFDNRSLLHVFCGFLSQTAKV